MPVAARDIERTQATPGVDVGQMPTVPERASLAARSCTPMSAAFQESFADATVEDIKHKGIEQIGGPVGSIYLTAVRFSNGVVVVFGGGRPEIELPAGSCAGSGGDCTRSLADVESNRRFIQAASE